MNNKQLGLKIITVICLILIFIAIIYSLYSILIPKIVYQYKSSNWANADGEVIYSYVKSKNSNPGENFYFNYSYEVGDEKYSGDKLNIGYQGIKSFYLCLAYETLSRQYPSGRKVTVYYDPDNPHLCTLNPGGIHWLFASVVSFLLLLVYKMLGNVYLILMNKLPQKYYDSF